MLLLIDNLFLLNFYVTLNIKIIVNDAKRGLIKTIKSITLVIYTKNN